MTPRPLCDFLVASCVEDGGIFRYRLYDGGAVEQIARIPLSEPMWCEQRGDVLTVLLRAPFPGKEESGVGLFRLSDGKPLSAVIPTQGKVGCHLAVDGEEIYCANYTSGSLIKLPDTLVTHEGHGVDPKRQECPHVHSVFLSPDKKYILSCDLGLDTVFVYDRDLRPVSTAKVPAGAGPRHLCFSQDGKTVYVINEMGGSLSLFSYADGVLSPRVTLPITKDGGKGKGAAVKISADGKRLYATERADEAIVLFAVGLDGTLTVADRTDSHGAEPRDFALIADEKYAVCTNQFGNNFALFRVGGEGKLTFVSQTPLPGALCVAEIR